MKNQWQYLYPYLWLFSFSVSSASALADDAWFCKEAASERKGSVLLACGVDTDATENGARKKALAAAFEELDSICDRSVDCKTFELQIDPQRNDCQKEKNEYKCYRALRATITTIKRAETYAKGESFKKALNEALQKIEITVKHEIKVDGKGLGFTRIPGCEVDIQPLSDALTDLSTEAKRARVASEAVKVPFSAECARVHGKLLYVLTENKLSLPAYTAFVINGLEKIADPTSDGRVEYALNYFHAPGQMPDREWNAALATVARTPHSHYRYLPTLFYPEVTSESAQSLEKKRVDAFFAAVQRGEYGKPVATGPDEALAQLLRAVTGHGKERKTWLALYAYARFRPALKYDKSDRLTEALMALTQAGDEEKGRNWVNEWIAELAQKSEPTRGTSLAFERYLKELDEELKKQDDEEEAGARDIKLVKALKASFIAKAGPSLGKHLAVTYDDNDRRQRGIFCVKQGISCPDLVPDKERIAKLLRSKKAEKRVEALELLRWMPKLAQSFEDDLIVNLEEEPAQAGLDAGEYMSRIHASLMHVIAELPSPSVKLYRRMIELNVTIHDRDDRTKIQPGYEPHLVGALKNQNVNIRAHAARILESFDKLSEKSCAQLVKETKGREPTTVTDYPGNVAYHKCKGRGTDWGD